MNSPKKPNKRHARKPCKTRRRLPAGKPAFDWPTAESKRQAAELLGWPVTVLDQLQRAGAPGFEHGRVYLGALIPWLGRRGLDDADIDWARELKKEQTLKARSERTAREKLTASKAEVREGLASIADLIFGELGRHFTQELPPDLQGRDEIAIRARCDVAINRLRDALRAQFRAILTAPGATAETEGA